MRRFSRNQLIAALIAVAVLVAMAVAIAAARGLGGGSDFFDVDSSEPSPGDRSGEVTGDGGAGSPTDSVNGSSPGGAPGPRVPNPPPPAGPDTPVSSDDSPRPQPTAIYDPPTAFSGIRTFEDCAAAGYPVAESYPEQCRTPDGRLFVRVID